MPKVIHAALLLILPVVVAAQPLKPATKVLFSPHGGCTDTVVKEIRDARTSIRIQAYSFTSQMIAKAIIDAQRRGVKVQAILDKSNRTARYSAATFLKNQGAEVRIDARHAIAHNKIIIIDDQTIITGSFNFTKAAEESNAENLLVLRDQPDIARQYVANWTKHYEHSEPYEAKADEAREGTKKTEDDGDKRVSTAEKVYVTAKGGSYHRSGCRYLKSDPIALSVKEAKAKGKAPCKVCQPPE